MPKRLSLTLAAAAALAWRPDIVHCHDWHAALVLALAARQPALEGAGTVLTPRLTSQLRVKLGTIRPAITDTSST